MVEICAPDDPRVQVAITVPLRGGAAMTLSIPRVEFIEEPVHKAMVAALTKLDDTPAEELDQHDRTRLAILAQIKPFVSGKDYKTCEGLTLGQLVGIRDHWYEQSAIPLGEYLASAPCSTANTGAPSNTTSSSGDGDAVTSDAA